MVLLSQKLPFSLNFLKKLSKLKLQRLVLMPVSAVFVGLLFLEGFRLL